MMSDDSQWYCRSAPSTKKVLFVKFLCVNGSIFGVKIDECDPTYVNVTDRYRTQFFFLPLAMASTRCGSLNFHFVYALRNRIYHMD